MSLEVNLGPSCASLFQYDRPSVCTLYSKTGNDTIHVLVSFLPRPLLHDLLLVV